MRRAAQGYLRAAPAESDAAAAGRAPADFYQAIMFAGAPPRGEPRPAAAAAVYSVSGEAHVLLVDERRVVGGAAPAASVCAVGTGGAPTGGRPGQVVGPGVGPARPSTSVPRGNVGGNY